MKKTILIAKYIALFIILFAGYEIANLLMTMPDNVALVAGFILMTVIVCFTLFSIVAPLIKKLSNSINKKS